jgi:hypothetical protein
MPLTIPLSSIIIQEATHRHHIIIKDERSNPAMSSTPRSTGKDIQFFRKYSKESKYASVVNHVKQHITEEVGETPSFRAK